MYLLYIITSFIFEHNTFVHNIFNNLPENRKRVWAQSNYNLKITGGLKKEIDVKSKSHIKTLGKLLNWKKYIELYNKEVNILQLKILN
jgi:hypothetical protein